MALTKDAPVPQSVGEFTDLPVAAATKIFEGAMVTVNAAGFAKNLVGADTILAGIAYRGADNAAGADGDVRVRVHRDVRYHEVDVSGVAQANVGDAVYMSDENTYTLTSTSNMLVGRIAQFLGGTKVVVRIEPTI